jgi:hypothetical protein
MSRKRQERRREEQYRQRQREQQAAKKREADAHTDDAMAQIQLTAKIMSASGYTRQKITHNPAPSPPLEPPPVFSECVIGYRHWLLDPVGQLRAITMTKQVWQPGVNIARCRPRDHSGPSTVWVPGFATDAPDESHPAPDARCHCGLYGWNDLPENLSAHGRVDADGRLPVIGAIAAWGDLRVHHEGFRASRACIVTLSYDDATISRVRGTLRRVAAEYRVPLVHVEALQAEAERHGTPLPRDVRPSKSVELWSTFQSHYYLVPASPSPPPPQT